MRKIRLRQIKIITPKGKGLTEEQVKAEVQRAQRLIDAIGSATYPQKTQRSKSQPMKISE